MPPHKYSAAVTGSLSIYILVGTAFMRSHVLRALFFCAPLTWAQQPAPDAVRAAPDPITTMVGRLNLESYKATIKGLTQFGDRRQGTDRNHAAVDWIEAQLKSYGCTNTERIHYDYSPPTPVPPATPPAASPSPNLVRGGARLRGTRSPIAVNNDAMKQPDENLRK